MQDTIFFSLSSIQSDGYLLLGSVLLAAIGAGLMLWASRKTSEEDKK